MNYFIKRLVLFLAFVGVFYIVALCVIVNIVPTYYLNNVKYLNRAFGHTYSRLQEAKQIKSIDVLFLGSSHSYRGIDTRIFNAQNISCFNLGSSSQTPLQTELLLERYCTTLSPKLIAIEVCATSLSSDGVESSLDIVSNDYINWQLIKLCVKHNSIKVYNTLIYSMIANSFKNINTYTEAAIKNEDTYIKGGYVHRQLHCYKHSTQPIQTLIPNIQQQQALQRIVAKYPNVLLYQSPVTKVLYNSITNNNYYDLLLSTHKQYYNFQTKIELNDSLHFYDEHHLNQTGVMLFNTTFIQFIKAKYLP